MGVGWIAMKLQVLKWCFCLFFASLCKKNWYSIYSFSQWFSGKWRNVWNEKLLLEIHPRKAHHFGYPVVSFRECTCIFHWTMMEGMGTSTNTRHAQSKKHSGQIICSNPTARWENPKWCWKIRESHPKNAQKIRIERNYRKICPESFDSVLCSILRLLFCLRFFPFQIYWFESEVKTPARIPPKPPPKISPKLPGIHLFSPQLLPDLRQHRRRLRRQRPRGHGGLRCRRFRGFGVAVPRRLGFFGAANFDQGRLEIFSNY